MKRAEQWPQRDFSLKEILIEKRFTAFQLPRVEAAGLIGGKKINQSNKPTLVNITLK